MSFFERLFQVVTSRGIGRALRYKYYVAMEFFGWFSSAGLWFHRTAVGWLTWDLTESGAWLGLVVAGEAIPASTPWAETD